MKSKNKQILVVGDRVLIRPDKGERKSKAGLYLPPSVIEKQEVLSGIVVEVGPGIPLGNPEDNMDEPWSVNDGGTVKYIPPQAEVGDMALFVNKATIEIKIESEEGKGTNVKPARLTTRYLKYLNDPTYKMIITKYES